MLDPDELVAGRTQAQLTTEWWQLMRSIPNDPVGNNPIADETGAAAGLGELSDIFFLAGGFSVVTRDITVPNNKPLFVPLVNISVDNIGATDDPNDPNFFGNLPIDSNDGGIVTVPDEDCFVGANPDNPASLRDCAASSINTINALSLTINGIDVATAGIDLFDYRQKSPEAFSYLGVDGDVFGNADGDFLNNPGQSIQLQLPTPIFPTVSDGFWVPVAPLPKGTYTLQFISKFDIDDSDDEAFQNVTYNITSVPVPESNSVLGLLALGAFGIGSALTGKLT